MASGTSRAATAAKASQSLTAAERAMENSPSSNRWKAPRESDERTGFNTVGLMFWGTPAKSPRYSV